MFTEELPEEIPARARITTPARRAAAQSIGDHLRPVSSVADELGMDWRIAHDAFVAYADAVLPAWAAAGAGTRDHETRRGKGEYEIETSTGVKVWVDRFDTGLIDLDGTGGGCSRRSTAAQPTQVLRLISASGELRSPGGTMPDPPRSRRAR